MSENIRGALLMMAAMSSFVINDAFMKALLVEMPIFQGLFLRGALATVLLAGIVWATSGMVRLDGRAWRALGARTLAEVGAVWVFMLALVAIPFANVSAILQALPLTVTLGAAMFLGQPIGWRRLLAILIGFAGVLMIIRPGTEGFSGVSFLVVICVVFATARDLLSRALPQGVPAFFVAMITSAGITVFAGAGALATGEWTAFGLPQVGLITAAALFLMIAYTAIFAAMQSGEIAFIAPFRYTSLVVTILIGVFVFGEGLDAWMLLGATIVVAMGCFTFWRGRHLAQPKPLPGRNG